MSKINKTNLKRAFRQELSKPSVKYVSDTRAMIEGFDEGSHLILNILTMRNIKFILVGIPVVIFILLISLLAGTVLNQNGHSSPRTNNKNIITLTNQEKEVVLKHVGEVNNLSVHSIGVKGNMPTLVPGEANNYRYTKIDRKWGQGLQKCQDFSPNVLTEDVIDYYEEYRVGEYDYFKIKETLTDGTLINYQLNLNKPHSVDTYEYQGGEYAIHKYITFIAQEGDSIPIDNVSLDDVGAQLGRNIEIKKVEEEGKAFYLIELKSDTKCSNKVVDTVTEIFVDPLSYELVKEQTYIGSKSQDNLILDFTYDIETKQISSKDADSMFRYDLKAPIKKDAVNSIEEDMKFMDAKNIEYMQSPGRTFLRPANYKINYLHFQLNSVLQAMNTQGEAYLRDRKFYLPGKIGDFLFKNASVTIVSGSEISNYVISYADSKYKETISVQLEQYDSMPSFFNDTVLQKTPITVGDKKVELTIFGKDKTPDAAKKTAYYGHFEYEGFFYNMTLITKSNNYDFSTLKFEVLASSNKDNSTYLVNLYNKSIKE